MFEEFRKQIQTYFCPNIAIAYNESIDDQLSQRFNLRLDDLLRPFLKLNFDVKIQETTSGGISQVLSDFKFNLQNVNSKKLPADMVTAQWFETVADETSDCDCDYDEIEHGHLRFRVPGRCPWFERWQRTFLASQPCFVHEYLKHNLACVYAIESRPDNSFRDLDQLMTNARKSTASDRMRTDHVSPCWFDANVLQIVLLVHFGTSATATATSEQSALENFRVLKKQYGETSCYFLNFAKQSSPELSCERLRELFPAERCGRRPAPSRESSSVSPAAAAASNNNNPIRELFKSAPEIDHPLAMSSNSGDPFTLELVDEPNMIAAGGTQPGINLQESHIKQITEFIERFTRTNFVPFCERKLLELNENVTNLKTVSRSLLTATKSWFQTPKTDHLRAQQLSENSHIFASDSLELKHRRLADLYFLLRFYKHAADAYLSIKKEFHVNQAWLHYAGALEMSLVSQILHELSGGGVTGATTAPSPSPQTTKRLFETFNECINIYLGCKKIDLALRTVLIQMEYFKRVKNRELCFEMANQLIRVAAVTGSDGDGDGNGNTTNALKQALISEQAAYLYARSTTTTQLRFARKFAFALALAAMRFRNANQKTHSIRCFELSLKFYAQQRNWPTMADKIRIVTGDFLYSHSNFADALKSYAAVFEQDRRHCSIHAQTFDQLPLQILGNFFDCLNRSAEPSGRVSLPKILFLVRPPSIDVNNTQTAVRVPHSTTELFRKLEELVFNFVMQKEQQSSLSSPSSTIRFESKIPFPRQMTGDRNRIVLALGDRVSIVCRLSNPLASDLTLSDLKLLYDFDDSNGENKHSVNLFTTCDHTDTVLDLESIYETNCDKSTNMCKNSEFQISKKTEIELKLVFRPLKTGFVTITGLRCRLVVSETQSYTNSRIEFVSSDENRYDFFIDPAIVTKLSACLSAVPDASNPVFYASEMRPLELELLNAGTRPISCIYLITSSADSILFARNDDRFAAVDESNDGADDLFAACTRSKIDPVFGTNVKLIRLRNGLDVNASLRLPFHLKSARSHDYFCDLLIFYGNIEDFAAVQSLLPYRLLQFNWPMKSTHSFKVEQFVWRNHHTKFKQEICLNLRLTNQMPERTIQLDRVIFHGNKWKLLKAYSISHNRLEAQQSYSILFHLIGCCGANETTIDLHASNGKKKRDSFAIDLQTINLYGRLRKNDAIISIDWRTDDAATNRPCSGSKDIEIESFSQQIRRREAASVGGTKNLARRTSGSGSGSGSEKIKIDESASIGAADQLISYQFSFVSRVSSENFDFARPLEVPIKITFYNGTGAKVQLKILFLNESKLKNDAVEDELNFRWKTHRTKLIEVTAKSMSFVFETIALFSLPGLYDITDQLIVQKFDSKSQTYEELDSCETMKRNAPILITHTTHHGLLKNR